MAYYQLLGKRTLVSPSPSPPSYILTAAVNQVYWCSPEYGNMAKLTKASSSKPTKEVI